MGFDADVDKRIGCELINDDDGSDRNDNVGVCERGGENFIDDGNKDKPDDVYNDDDGDDGRGGGDAIDGILKLLIILELIVALWSRSRYSID
ncbi:hypothetical protein QR98_0050370 [Sarcoptes scabiei]|uniref:Uncharacterized protein n=1 Tax=Sarcoptes scabiei TaxID=52283 RepID=A0A132A818_SARSC|nr:hypothetical protein QR98_0050370 [Sarcoptes scabiei]